MSGRRAGHEAEVLEIIAGGLQGPRVVALLEVHLTRGDAETALGSAHALDIAALEAPALSLETGSQAYFPPRGRFIAAAGSWSAGRSQATGLIPTPCSCRWILALHDEFSDCRGDQLRFFPRYEMPGGG
jgi:hypothetical protein